MFLSSESRTPVGHLFALLLFLALGAGPGALTAQETEPASRGSELTVYLMTMGPGDYVWERFGHNAIWIHDSLNQTDIAYNYGMFSFDQDDFILRFIRGDGDYWMEGFDAEAMASVYIRSNRSVWAQELSLSPAQRANLRDFLEWNAQPENRTYRYDYYRDNCSTRVRDALDMVLGGRLRLATEGRDAGSTYRKRTRPLTLEDPPIYAGIMLGLGPAADREISVWEDMFLPLRMMEHVRRLSHLGEDGREVPLVAAEFVLFEADRPAAPAASGPRIGVAALLGLALAGSLLLAARAWQRSRGARIAVLVLGGGWAVVGGILSLVLIGLWTLTAHTVAYGNENLFFVTPLLLPMAVLLPVLLRKGDRMAGWAMVPAAALVASSLLGLILQPLPSFTQENGEIIAFALPANVALAAAVWLIVRSARGTEGEAARATAGSRRGGRRSKASGSVA